MWCPGHFVVTEKRDGDLTASLLTARVRLCLVPSTLPAGMMVVPGCLIVTGRRDSGDLVA